MSKASSPTLLVTFQDETVVELQCRPKDAARAELAGHDFQTGGPIMALYATAYACLGRLDRSGVLPEGVTVPESIEAFVDACDVEPKDIDEETDDEGEAGGQGPSSG